MDINIYTAIKLNLTPDEFSQLLAEVSTYSEENDTELGDLLELFYEDLMKYKNKVSEFTITTKFEMSCFGGQLFFDMTDEIEDIDIDIYPSLSNLLITIINKI